MGKIIRVYELLNGTWTHDGEENAEAFEGEYAKSMATMSACKVPGDNYITIDYSNAEKKRAKELGLDLKRMVSKPKKREWYR